MFTFPSTLFSANYASGTHNLITYSEQFDNPVWSNENVVITPNTVVAPDGTTTADSANYTTTSSKVYRAVGQAAVLTVGQQYTFSVYAKAASGTFSFKLATTDQTTWATALVSSEFTADTTWQRFQFTFTAFSTVGDFVIGDEDRTGYVLPQTGILYLWGAQVNRGSTALTYIKTTGSIIP